MDTIILMFYKGNEPFPHYFSFLFEKSTCLLGCVPLVKIKDGFCCIFIFALQIFQICVFKDYEVKETFFMNHLQHQKLLNCSRAIPKKVYF